MEFLRFDPMARLLALRRETFHQFTRCPICLTLVSCGWSTLAERGKRNWNHLNDDPRVILEPNYSACACLVEVSSNKLKRHSHSTLLFYLLTVACLDNFNQRFSHFLQNPIFGVYYKVFLFVVEESSQNNHLLNFPFCLCPFQISFAE
jgi:hypothetical protein